MNMDVAKITFKQRSQETILLVEMWQNNFLLYYRTSVNVEY